MKISLAQIDADVDKERNLARIRSSARDARDRGADLVAFPEFAMYEKKVVDDTFAGAAEPLDGPFVRSLQSLAAQLRVGLVVGVVEHTAHDRRPHNTLVAIGPDGALLAAYRKVHLFDSYGFHESAHIAPAPDLAPVTFDLGGARIGLMTCYDLRFPELARMLVDAGTQVMLVCSSWVPGDGKAEQWRVLARARAIENACFVAAVSQTPPVSIGRSLVADPAGAVMCELGTAPAVAVIDVDVARIARMRAKNPALEHRRYAVAPGDLATTAAAPAPSAVVGD